MPAAGPEVATVAELAAAMASGRTTSREIVEVHLDRIDRLDGAFAAVRCIAPDALAEADASDARRRSGAPRGSLEGIPVLIKDNVDVAGLPTTGGALALEQSRPRRDAPLVAGLRAAGAIVLGKTNLSELANFLTEDMPSGYSSLGGQVLNPYDTSISPSGSSSGSGTAVALGLAPLAVGSETDGSITSPAERQSLVGFKPTVGMVSRTGILPISGSQDTAGPMTRTVADAAVMLEAMAGPDPRDPATVDGRRADRLTDARPRGAGALSGVRLGVVPVPADETPGRVEAHAGALEALRTAGAELVDVALPALDGRDEDVVLHYEFAPAVDAYLATLGPDAPVRSFADLRAWNRAHAGVALKFGQVHVDRAAAVDHARDRTTYDRARARDLAVTTGGLEAALGDDLEALVFAGCSGCSWAARAGWPSVVLPAGYEAANRRPFGIMLVARRWEDWKLLDLAAGAEVALPARKSPWEINPAAFRHLTT